MLTRVLTGEMIQAAWDVVEDELETHGGATSIWDLVQRLRREYRQGSLRGFFLPHDMTMIELLRVLERNRFITIDRWNNIVKRKSNTPQR